jgi:predicted PurR-regulated permease PerM
VGAGLVLLLEIGRILTWIVISAFFAVALTPLVNIVQRRAHVPRGAAVTIVFVVVMLAFAAMLYAFIHPLVVESRDFADNATTYVADARAGRGPVGHLVKKYDLDERFDQNKDRLNDWIKSLGSNSARIASGVGTAIAGTVTIIVLTILMLLEGPKMLATGLNALAPGRRERVRRVASDCARAVSGYVAGNLLISFIAGVTTYIFLWISGVPFRGVLALWVAVSDLIPLIGATMGAVVVIGVAFIHSVPAGIAAVIFYVVYQQFENHVLQVTIMARTVDLNPLTVLVSVLIGVELFGILGALLAIPVAGIIQVVARDLWDERTGRPKPEPTIGEDEVPVSQAEDDTGFLEAVQTSDAPEAR